MMSSLNCAAAACGDTWTYAADGASAALALHEMAHDLRRPADLASFGELQPPHAGETSMERRQFAAVGIAAGTIAALGQVAAGQQPRADRRDQDRQTGRARRHRGYSRDFEECAQACSDCQRECNRCAIHCADLVARGHGHHQETLKICLDCAAFCATASEIVSRGGPLAELICQGCADACRRCGEECEQHRDSPEMQRCAEECFRCEQACRDMLRQTRR
jgi:hypothetical protein